MYHACLPHMRYRANEQHRAFFYQGGTKQRDITLLVRAVLVREGAAAADLPLLRCGTQACENRGRRAARKLQMGKLGKIIRLAMTSLSLRLRP